MNSTGDVSKEVLALASSDERRVSPTVAAQVLGVHRRTLEEWRRSWRKANEEGRPELRKGPRFVKVGRRVLYVIRDLKEWKTPHLANVDMATPTVAADFLGVHVRTLEDQRKTWKRAEIEGNPSLRQGPPFHKAGGRVFYEWPALVAYRYWRQQALDIQADTLATAK